MSVPVILQVVIYAAITAAFVYTWIHDTELWNSGKYKIMRGFPFDDSFGRRLKFLTYINMGIDTAYFALVTLNALRRLFSSGRSVLDGIIDRLFTSFVFPTSIIVVGSFWVVYFIDRSLVYPIKLDTFIPSWQNHVMHSLPLVGALLDTLFVFHNYPKFLNGLALTLSFAIGYLAWVFYIAYESNQWVYGMLAVLDNVSRAAFVALQLSAITLSYSIGEKLNSYLWKGKTTKQRSKKIK